jgi:hypothetical protein
MNNQDLVGVWESDGEERVRPDGSVERAPARLARIMYTADGHMAVVSAYKDRRPVAEQGSRMDLDGTTAEERAEATRGCVAYAGRFEVRGDIVHHHIDVALNPNLVGQTRTRRIAFIGDVLTLNTPPDAEGGHGRIRWKRVART